MLTVKYLFVAATLATTSLFGMYEPMEVDKDQISSTINARKGPSESELAIYLIKYMPIAQYLSDNGLPREVVALIFTPLLQIACKFKIIFNASDLWYDYRYSSDEFLESINKRAPLGRLRLFIDSCSVDEVISLFIITEDFLPYISAMIAAAVNSKELETILLMLKISKI